MNAKSVATNVSLSTDCVEIRIDDRRRDTLSSFARLSEGQREQLAREAWKVGHGAIVTAYAQAERVQLEDVGARLMSDLDEQLEAFVSRQQATLQETLARYFDLDGGQLTERLQHFLADGGTLTHLLQRHLGPENSVLAETLARQVGQQSPLFRKLSPTDSEGLVHVMATKLEEVLRAEHQQFKNALDPFCEEGAVARFIKRLQETLKRAEDDQNAQLAAALCALDATDPNSLLSQLKRETSDARTMLLEAINPALESSPLAILRRALSEQLAEHTKSQADALAEARKEQLEFQKELRDAVLRIELRRKELLRNSCGGAVYQDAVIDLIQRQLSSAGFIVQNTANVVGIRTGCKTGDAVVTFPSEHLFAGARIVVEAKREKGYGVAKALDELARARTNREACVGIFVMARSHVPAGFPSFARFGCDVLVVWDDEDPSTDPYLQGALMVGLALATRSRSNAEPGDLQALSKIEQRIVRELERLETIRDAAARIRKQVETIEQEVAIGTKNLGRIVEDAKKTLTALNVELSDDKLEHDSPIVVPGAAAQNDFASDAGAAE